MSEELYPQNGCGCASDAGDCNCEDIEESDEDDDDWTTEDAAVEAHNMADALIEVLEKKGLVTRQEVENMIEQMLDEDSDDDEENTSSQSQF